MFENNLKALMSINPTLCGSLEKLHGEPLDESIALAQAKSGEYILGINGVPLDNVISPSKGAQEDVEKSILSKVGKNDFIVLYGLGMGYMLDELFLKYESKIVVYEPNISVLRFVFENVDMTSYLSSKRVFITNNDEICLNYLKNHFIAGDKLEITYPTNYVVYYQQTMTEFIEGVYNILKRNIIDINTTKKLSEVWTKNVITNSRRIKNKILFSQLENKFKGRTAMVLGAGPSLKDNISTIRENRDKFTIFAVNRTLTFLEKEEIVPDFAIFTDASYLKNTTSDLSDEYIKKLNIIADIKASTSVFELDCKNLIVYLPANESLSSLIAQENNIKPQETYGTAAAVALYCAKELGAKEIICSGIDLAFKNDEFYSDGKGKIEGDNLLVDNYSMHLTEVKSKDGNMVKTRDDYASFIPQFETICKKFGKGVKVYNVTDFGAYIEGMEYKKLSEILPSKKSKVNTDKILSEIEPLNIDYEAKINEEWIKAEKFIDEITKNKKIKLGELIQNTMDCALLYSACQYEILNLEKMNFSDESIENYKKYVTDLGDRLRKTYYELD